MKGGYQLIDFQNINHDNNMSQSTKGIWNQIKNSNGKLLIATNFIYNNNRWNDFTLTLSAEETASPIAEKLVKTTIVKGDYSYTITIYSNDVVKVQEA